LHLAKLEIVGFKSFANRAQLEFGPGISAIVGPNGCGKTNIIDAIRWVLGEQSPKNLRAGSMRDLIFKGTKLRRPLGLAEVSLVLVGDLPHPYGDTVKLSRRLTGDGETTYMINDLPVRLKDIQALLYDTGFGVGSYYHIDQDTIEKILASNPEERRSLFEEAAGISKFKRDCHEATLKLNSTKQKLETLQVIINERNDKVEFLRKEATKAKRFILFKREIMEIGARLFKSRLVRIGSEIKNKKCELDEYKRQNEKVSSLIAEAEVKKEMLRLALNETELELRNITEQIRAKDVEKNKLAIEVATLRERSSSLRRAIESSKAKLVELEQNSARVSAEKEKLISDEERIKAELASTSEEHKRVLANRDEFDKKLVHLQELSRADRTQIEQIKNQLSKIQQNLLFKGMVISASRNEIENLSNELKGLSAGLEAEETRLKALQGEIETFQQKLEKISENLKKANSRLSIYTEEEAKLSELARNIEREIIEARSKIESIDKLLTKRETKGTAKAQLVNESQGLQILGELAELIDTDYNGSKILEQALGEILSYFVVMHATEATKAIEFLAKSNESGGFVVLDELRAIRTNPPTAYINANDIAHASIPEIENLLSNIWIEKGNNDFGTQPKEHGIYIVSADGKLFSSPGIRRFGTKSIEEGSLSLRVLRKESQKILEEKSHLQEDLLKKIGFTQIEIQKLKSEIERLKEDEETIKGKIYSLVSENEKLKLTLSHKKEKTREIQKRIKAEEDKIGLTEKEIERLKQEEHELIERQKELEQTNREKYKSISEFEQQSKELGKSLAQLELKKARLEENLRNIAREIERNRIETESNRAKTEEEKARIIKYENECASISKEIEKKENLIKDIENAKSELNSRISILEERLSSITLDIQGLENELKENRKNQNALEEKIRELEVHLAKLQEREQNIIAQREIEGFTEDIQMDKPLPVEEENALEDKLAKRKKSLENLGIGVNIESIDEYEEQKKHLDFLLEQKHDLEIAMNNLNETIKRLERESRKRFVETFELAREGFRRYFSELFHGGEADLVLKGDDPLSAEIEILAHPPGKRMLPLTQLSTGENYLTAFALLFGLYSIKPAPFCLLDEVDAPLDEVNTKRFFNLLRAASSNTQFILITHNRVVMESVDYLYGVTMEEEGLSRLVSLKLEDVLAE